MSARHRDLFSNGSQTGIQNSVQNSCRIVYVIPTQTGSIINSTLHKTSQLLSVPRSNCYLQTVQSHEWRYRVTHILLDYTCVYASSDLVVSDKYRHRDVSGLLHWAPISHLLVALATSVDGMDESLWNPTGQSRYDKVPAAVCCHGKLPLLSEVTSGGHDCVSGTCDEDKNHIITSSRRFLLLIGTHWCMCACQLLTQGHHDKDRHSCLPSSCSPECNH